MFVALYRQPAGATAFGSVAQGIGSFSTVQNSPAAPLDVLEVIGGGGGAVENTGFPLAFRHPPPRCAAARPARSRDRPLNAKCPCVGWLSTPHCTACLRRARHPSNALLRSFGTHRTGNIWWRRDCGCPLPARLIVAAPGRSCGLWCILEIMRHERRVCQSSVL